MSALEIFPLDFARWLDAGEEWHLLDVRAPDRLATGRLDLVPPERFHHVSGSVVVAATDPESLGLDRGARLAVVCAKGNDSLRVAFHLRSLGVEAYSIAGGMRAWMATVLPRELEPPRPLDGLVQLDRVGKGALAYLLSSAGEAFVIDPPRRLDAIFDLLEGRRLKLVGVADTHAHADYLSGGPTLASACRVPYYLSPRDAVLPFDGRHTEIGYTPILAGRRIRVGAAELMVEETPGHTEGSVTFRLGERLAFTGDFLFVDSVGRPDLGGKVDKWTALLFESLSRARRSWPESLEILPAHYSSDRERRADRTVRAWFSDLLEYNGPLSIVEEELFVAWVGDRMRDFPDAYRKIKTANLGFLDLTDDESDELETGRNECALG